MIKNFISMSFATAAIYIDKSHPRKNGECSVSIRITYDRKKKYYPTGFLLSIEDYERIFNAKRKKESDKAIYNRIRAFETKAIEAIGKLQTFTFLMFEEIYLNNRDAPENISTGFKTRINQLKDEKRIGNAIAYECAIKSLESFKPGLKYADITPVFLRNYERWMIEDRVNDQGEFFKGKSITTVGIYLRHLRAILNEAAIDKSLLPFGNAKGKYQIPTSKNIKKALTKDEIGAIFHFADFKGKYESMARDYWIFIYLCNGINVKDFCFLKWKDIDGDILKFERAKTSRTKKVAIKITVSLKPEAKAVIDKWGQDSKDPESYIFPHLQKGMSPERERQIHQQLTKLINKHMKRIAERIGIKRPVTTYTARHCFATILKNSGATIPFIGESLGHSGKDSTKSYLASFEDEAIHEITNALTAFIK